MNRRDVYKFPKNINKILFLFTLSDTEGEYLDLY